MKVTSPAATFIVTGLFLAACQDLPTSAGSDPSPPANPAPRYSAGNHASIIACAISRRVQGRAYPYEYGTLRLHFPANTIAADGSTRLFRWRVQAPGEEPVVTGSCQIPNTPAAVDFAMKRLRLNAAARRKEDDGVVTIQDCVKDGFCHVDGIVVVAPGPSWGWRTGGGGGSDTGHWGSQGDYYEPTGGGYGDDPGPDATYRPECTRNANGYCETRSAEAEWSTLGERIEQLHTPTAACARAKEILRGLHALGPSAQRIRVWDGFDVYYDDGDERWEQRLGQNLSDANGRYIEFDSYWMLRDQQLLAHEALHWYLNEQNSALTGDAAEQWIAAEQRKCATGVG